MTCLVVLLSCARESQAYDSSCEYAEFFDIKDSLLLVVSPYDGSIQTVSLCRPMSKIICMSSSQVAALDQIGAESSVAAVSGMKYLTNQRLHERNSPDIGYEASLDYEKIIGIRPGQYILQQRLNAACRLLEETDLGITEIALNTGFCDHSHLTKMFKQERKTTPGEYRQIHRIHA